MTKKKSIKRWTSSVTIFAVCCISVKTTLGLDGNHMETTRAKIRSPEDHFWDFRCPSVDSNRNCTAMASLLPKQQSATSEVNATSSSTTIVNTSSCLIEHSETFPLYTLDNITNCFLSVICSARNVSIVSTSIINVSIYWLKNANLMCARKLFSAGGTAVSRSKTFINGVEFVILNPACKQSKELVQLEVLEKNLTMLPIPCRKLLCYAGMGKLHFDRIPITLLYPRHNSLYDLVDECQAVLQNRTRDANISTETGHVNVFHTERYPKSSPCSMYTVLVIMPTKKHLVIPFRSTWCPTMKRHSWREILFSSYRTFLSGSKLQLYKCMTEKKQESVSEIRRYANFYQDLLGNNVEIPNIPQSCISFLCDSNVGILNVHHSRSGEVLYWFSNVIYNAHKDLNPKLLSQVAVCQEKLSQENNQTLINSVILPGTIGRRALPLVLTAKWSCPNVENEKESYYLKAEILATLRLVDEDLPQACKNLICHATIKRLSKNLTRSVITLTNHSSGFCEELSHHKTQYNNEEYIFSFDIRQINSTIVFIILRSQVNEKTLDILSFLHSGDSTEYAKCCSNTYKDLTKHMYIYRKNHYYTCHIDSNDNFASTCLSENASWQMQLIGEKSYLITVESQFRGSKLIHWLATLEITLSGTSLEYISSLNINSQHFLNHVIFVSISQIIKDSKFMEFISQMQNGSVLCSHSHLFTICHRPDAKFHSPLGPEGYLVFLHDCLVNDTQNDKLKLLLLRHFLGTGPGEEYICQGNTMVVMTHLPSKHVFYSVKGTSEDALVTLARFRSATPKWMWSQRNLTVTNAIDSYNCHEYNSVEKVFNALKFDTCAQFQMNKSFISLHVQQNMYFQTFPLKRTEPNTLTFDLSVTRNHSSWFPNNYYLHHLNATIYTTTLESNPAHDFLQRYKASKVLDHRTSTAFLARVIMQAALTNNTQCLQELKNKDFLLYVSNDALWIGPMSDDQDTLCFSALSEDILGLVKRNIKHNMSTINKFWPTCSYDMLIFRYEGTSAIQDWDYLPISCKVQEFFIFTLVAMAIVIMLLGNIFVILMIFRLRLYRYPSHQIYISHAVADILMALFPGSMLIFDTVSIMSGSLTFQELNQGSSWGANLDRLISGSSIDPVHLNFERSGVPVFCSIVMNVAIGVSILNLVLQGIERLYVVLRRRMNHQHIITCIYATWIISIVFSILVNVRPGGWSFIAFLDPVTKLTLSFKMDESLNLFPALCISAAVFLIALSSIIVMFILLLYFANQYRSQAHEILMDKEMVPEEHQRRSTRTFQLLVCIFVASCLPVFIDRVCALDKINPIGHQIAWWLFLSLTSVKWMVYYIQSKMINHHNIGVTKVICLRQNDQCQQSQVKLNGSDEEETNHSHKSMEMKVIEAQISCDSEEG